MNEDPTRIMRPGDEPPRRRRPPQHQPRGNMRLVVAVMGAVIFGLFIALLVSGGGGETKTVTVTEQVTTEVEATPKTGSEKSSENEAGEGSEGEEGGVESEEETGGVEEEFVPEEGVEEEGAIEEIVPEEEVFEEEGGGVEAE
jgi:hypothetical protein